MTESALAQLARGHVSNSIRGLNSKRSLTIKAHSYKSVSSILKTGLDQASLKSITITPGPTHENIRGSEYYQ